MKAVFIVLTVIYLSSCSLNSFKDASEFKLRWEEAKDNRAISWWYLGETEEHYLIQERWFITQYHYEIPKTTWQINNILKALPCFLCQGQRLAKNQVVEAEQGSH